MRKTLQLFAALRKGIQNANCDETDNWIIENRNVSVDVYHPKKNNQQTIMIIHGMGRLGNRDPRMKNMCRQLSALGFTILAPSFPTIQACLILEEQSPEMTDVMRYALTQTTYCPTEKMSVMSISFSGSVATHAASHPDIQSAIKGVLSIGYAPNGAAAIRDLLLHPETDIYGHYVALKNAYYFLNLVDPVLDAGFDALIEDESPHMPDNHFKGYLNSLMPKDQARAEIYFNEIQSRTSLTPKQLSDEIDYKHLEKIYDFSSPLKNLPFRVTIIQDKNDKILFTEHVSTLQQQLSNNTHHVICMTDILSHADIKLSLKNFIALLKTIFAFSKFMKSALS